MTRTHHLTCAVLLAATLLMPSLSATAGEREVRYLNSLAGQYAGSGAQSIAGWRVTMRCSLRLSPSGSKLRYTSECRGGGSVSGTVSYEDGSGTWVVTTLGRKIPARRSGKSLTFSWSERDAKTSSTTTFTFAPGEAKLSFQLQLRGGPRGSGQVVFRRR